MFYHGTTDALVTKDTTLLLPPSRTRVIRKVNVQQVVFLTDDRTIAEGHAQKAAERFGGNPVVVKATADSAQKRGNATFTTKMAEVTEHIAL